MNKTFLIPVTLMFFVITGAMVAGSAGEDNGIAPPPFASLKTTIQIKWREVAPLPVVMNGGMIGKTNGFIVFATGFGRKAPKGILTNGYTNAAWAYEIQKDAWARIPNFPGTPRAYGTASGVTDGRYVYVFGGQSYAPPYVYKDVYRVSCEAGTWCWEKLPDMMWPTSEFGACILNGKLYVQGGAIWGTREKGNLSTGYWCTRTDRVGVRFQVLDLSNLKAGWKELPPLPGVHRSHHTLSAAGGKLYVFGGIAIPSEEKDPKRRGVFNVIDNYCYDLKGGEWKRIRDMPLPLGGHAALTWHDRFILLVGGFSGRNILLPSGEIRAPYGRCQGFEDRVFVYDTKTNSFSLATSMLRKINDTRLVWLNDSTIFEATGEIPKGRRIPDCQIGQIENIP